MAITLAGLSFDPANTVVKEQYEDVGGRRERTIQLTGLIIGESSVAEIEAALDAILDAASMEDYGAALSIRPGRRLWVRRDKFTREIEAGTLVGSFTLTLKAKDPFEESEASVTHSWGITVSGSTLSVACAGNVFSLPIISLTADGAVINPTLSDGVRTIQYLGTVGNGQTVAFDAVNGVVQLDGDNVTPYTTGDFPHIEPEGTTLTYTDDASSSHHASAIVEYRNRWW